MKQEFVDLGLPSGTLWAKHNVKIANKKHFTHYEIPLIEYITSYNVSSKEDFEELINLCKWEWKTIGRTKGYVVTGPNGNHIFLHAAGRYKNTTLNFSGVCGFYWSADYSNTSNAYCLGFGSKDKAMSIYYRYYGRSIRLVKRKSV